MTKQNKEPLKLINNNLVLSVQNNYTLSIQLSLDGFSFCIYNNSFCCIEVLEHYYFKLTSPEELLDQVEIIFKKEPLFNFTFNKVIVCHINNLSALVPKSLFDKEQIKNYLGYSVKTLENDFFDYDELDAINAINVYIPYVNINNYFIDKFGSFTYHHVSSLIIESLIAQNSLNTKPQMYAHICDSHFEIIVIQAQKLLLFNTFNYKTKEDFIYYILFTAEQLSLNPNTFSLVLLGNITTSDKLFTMAYQYVKNVKLYDYELNYKPMFALSDLQKRQFYSLLHQL